MPVAELTMPVARGGGVVELELPKPIGPTAGLGGNAPPAGGTYRSNTPRMRSRSLGLIKAGKP
ncbi:MAG: hypothetical protein LW697_11780 [Blastopirellula sp.]|nr:hypothetical protein [Blastopirellula sp.]